jgi:molecular chaperone HtpG
MKTGQDRIYYLIADTVTAARGSPYLEQLRAKGVEVLLLADRVDEWMMGHLREFEGKRFKDAARGDLELGGLEGEADKAAAEAAHKDAEPLLKRLKDALGERVSEVKVSTRLADSPACLVLDATPDGEGFNDLALLVFDQAKLAESGSVANPGEFVRRLNRLLGQLMTPGG